MQDVPDGRWTVVMGTEDPSGFSSCYYEGEGYGSFERREWGRHSLGRDGRWRDLYWYGLLREDFSPAVGPSKEEDVPAVIDLLRRRIAWMDEKGLYQWNKTGYLDCYPAEYFRHLVQAGILFTARNAAGLAGVMALLDRDSRWPNGDDGRALYVHHLATDPDRPGLGREMLAWAEDYARKQGKIFLRLDSQQANHALSRYYDSLGYSPVGTCVDGSYEGILREKALDPSTET